MKISAKWVGAQVGGRKGKVKKAQCLKEQAVKVQKLEEYGALAIDAKAALPEYDLFEGIVGRSGRKT